MLRVCGPLLRHAMRHFRVKSNETVQVRIPVRRVGRVAPCRTASKGRTPHTGKCMVPPSMLRARSTHFTGPLKCCNWFSVFKMLDIVRVFVLQLDRCVVQSAKLMLGARSLKQPARSLQLTSSPRGIVTWAAEVWASQTRSPTPDGGDIYRVLQQKPHMYNRSWTVSCPQILIRPGRDRVGQGWWRRLEFLVSRVCSWRRAGGLLVILLRDWRRRATRFIRDVHCLRHLWQCERVHVATLPGKASLFWRVSCERVPVRRYRCSLAQLHCHWQTGPLQAMQRGNDLLSNSPLAVAATFCREVADAKSNHPRLAHTAGVHRAGAQTAAAKMAGSALRLLLLAGCARSATLAACRSCADGGGTCCSAGQMCPGDVACCACPDPPCS